MRRELLSAWLHGRSASAAQPWASPPISDPRPSAREGFSPVPQSEHLAVSIISAKRISALVNLWGLVLVTPLGLWVAWSFDFGSVSPAHWGLLLFYSLAASMVTVWLWMTGLKHVPAASAGVFTVMLPVSAAAVGVLFLGERFSGGHAVAFGLALVGVVLATWPTRR